MLDILEFNILVNSAIDAYSGEKIDSLKIISKKISKEWNSKEFIEYRENLRSILSQDPMFPFVYSKLEYYGKLVDSITREEDYKSYNLFRYLSGLHSVLTIIDSSTLTIKNALEIEELYKEYYSDPPQRGSEVY